MRWLAITGDVSFAGTPARPVRMAGVAADVTDRKRREERQAFLLELADTLRALVHPGQVQAEVTRLLGRQLGAIRVQYWSAELDGEHFVSEGGYADGVPRFVGRVRLDDFGLPVREAFTAGRTLAVVDAAADPRVSTAELAAPEEFGFRAYLGVPLVKDGRLVAALGIYCPMAREWTNEEIALAEETAERTWASVERAHAEEALEERERQRDERYLRSVRRQQWLAGEQAERGRWARELHDDTLQGMAAVHMQLIAALQSPQRRDELLLGASDLIREEIAKLRTLISDLRPSALADFGLAPTLATLADEVHVRGGPEVVVELGDGARERLPAEMELAVYRIIQEAVRNAAQHAGASRVDVSIRRLGGQFEAVVTDDGSGFDPSVPGAGYGLVSMQERAALVGGTLGVSSGLRHGTRVRLVVPIS